MITLDVLPLEVDADLTIDVFSGGGTYNYEKLKNKPKLNGVELVGDISLTDVGIDAVGVAYENTEHPEFTNVDTALDKLIHKVWYVAPQITSFGIGSLVLDNEIGTTIPEVNFSWTLNKDVEKQELTGCTLTEADRTATYSVPFSSNKTFTLKVDDGENTASASKSFRFLPKVYSGVAEDSGVYDSAFILALGGSLKTGKAGTYTMNLGANQYGWIAVPTSYGKVSKCFVGGFETELTDCGTISVTNASGYTQNYYLSRTPNSNLGNISMVVS